jgi:hypothetical protein
MSATDTPDLKAGLERSIRLVGQAMEFLDASGAPSHLAVHLELALTELKAALAEQNRS